MKKWFPLVMVVALAALGSPLQAGIFDRLVNDTAQDAIPLANGGGEIVQASPEVHSAAPLMDYGYANQGPVQSGYGYPFKTGCCESQNPCIGDLWRGYCGRSHGCDRMHSRFAHGAHGQACGGGCGGGCGKGGCATGYCGKGGCATGHCGHGGIGLGKGFGHVQHGHVQQSYIAPKSPVQHSFGFRGHVQHGKGFSAYSGCNTCGQTPCGCGAKGHHQKGFGLGFHGKSCAGHGFGKGLAAGDCGCAAPVHGKGMNPHVRIGLFDRLHRCHTCGKSTGLGFGKGGCDCDNSAVTKGGWDTEGSVIFDKGHSFDAPQHGQPTPAYDPPVDLEIPTPTPDLLPVPPTPTSHSASLRRLPPVAGYQY